MNNKLFLLIALFAVTAQARMTVQQYSNRIDALHAELKRLEKRYKKDVVHSPSRVEKDLNRTADIKRKLQALIAERSKVEHHEAERNGSRSGLQAYGVAKRAKKALRMHEKVVRKITQARRS